jgi:hypothetical protein
MDLGGSRTLHVELLFNLFEARRTVTSWGYASDDGSYANGLSKLQRAGFCGPSVNIEPSLWRIFYVVVAVIANGKRGSGTTGRFEQLL